MDHGKRYKVVYSDGKSERVKDLIFIKREQPLLYFNSVAHDRDEIINENNVIRMEELKDDGQTKF